MGHDCRAARAGSAVVITETTLTGAGTPNPSVGVTSVIIDHESRLTLDR
jgi:hypothetical protein